MSVVITLMNSFSRLRVVSLSLNLFECTSRLPEINFPQIQRTRTSIFLELYALHCNISYIIYVICNNITQYVLIVQFPEKQGYTYT